MVNKRQESIDLLNSTHTFPQPVMIKVIGKNTPQFQEQVKQVFKQQLGVDSRLEFKLRETAAGRHLSITVEPQFQRAEQVLDLYEALKRVPDVVMLL